MAKLKGKIRWKRGNPFEELMALEIKLDSLHQKTMRQGKIELSEAEASWMLGAVRSALEKIGHKQKTLKRWIKPAPNQIQHKEK